MSVTVKGERQLQRELEARLGKARMQKIVDDALIKGAKVFVKYLKESIGTSGKYAKGWTVEDTTIEPPKTIGGVRTIRVHWNGSHGRYRIIHLNEWGTIKQKNPPRKGAIARGMRNAESEYRAIIKRELGRGI